MRRAESAARQAPRHELIIERTARSLIGRWDPARIERVLTNLVSNAIKYTPAAGVIVVTTAEEDAGTERWAVVTVRDQGIGIPEADLARLFTRFYRGSNTRGVEGTGIGLEAVRRLVDLHGGIRVDSTEGVGTTFTVRLPLERRQR